MLEVFFASKKVSKDLNCLPKAIQEKIMEQIRALKINPRPAACKKLSGKLLGSYRIRIGDYRVVYDVVDPERKVVILDIGHRKWIYL